MNNSIIELSDRGQLTIPKKIREEVVVKRFVCHFEGGKIILEPLQTREEFLEQLEEIKENYKKTNKGLSLKEMKKKYNL